MGNFPGPRPQRPKWRKSSYSGGGNNTCVELAAIGQAIGIRDSKNPDGPALRVTRGGLAHLLTTIKTS